MGRLIFSGHESFSCKQFWLKKGFDFVKSGKKFSDNTSVIDLGVGKNMVSSIRFWSNAFGVIEKKERTSFLGEYLLGENGKDIYLEDRGSVWLLHYHLVKNSIASIYDLTFNELLSVREEFTKELLHNFLKTKCEENKSTVYNKNTITKDINVFLKNYLAPAKKRVEIEDSFARLLHELNLITVNLREDLDGKKTEWYSINKGEKMEIPYQIVLFTILDSFENNNSISFRELRLGKNSPSRIFGLNAEGIYDKLKKIEEKYQEIVYSETAGNRVLQINTEINKWEILNEYYA